MAPTVTDFYRGRLATGNAALLARIQALWDRAFNPLDPSGSLPLIGATVGRWVTGAQAGAAAEATRYLSALIASRTSIPLEAVTPLSVPSGLVGRVANGSTAMSYLRQAPAVYFNRIGQGYPDAMAADSTRAWLNRTASSEPYRVANATVNGNATVDERFSGRVRRITRNNACDFCTLIADRGYIPSHADFEAHAHCRCTPEPEVSSHITSRSAMARGRQAELERQRRIGEQNRADERSAILERQAALARQGTGVDGIELRGFDDNDPTNMLSYFHAEAQTRDSLAKNLANISPEVQDRLSMVWAGSDDPYFNTHPDTLAYYQDLSRHISIRPSEYRPGALASMQATIDKGWWTPDGTAASSADRTLTHELGHFLDFQLSKEQRYEMLSRLGIDWGLETTEDAKVLVSRYGGSNDKEMIAELWAEYKTSPNPRGPALYAGRYIEDKLGTHPSPTPSMDEIRAMKAKAYGWAA